MSDDKGVEAGKEAKGPFYNVERGGFNKSEHYSKQQVRILVQSVLANSVNLSTLIGSGASMPTVPLMGSVFSEYRDSLEGEDKTSLDKKIEEFLKKRASDNQTTLSESTDANSEEVKKESENFKDIEPFLSWLDYRVLGGVDEAKDSALYKSIVTSLLKKIREGDAEEEQENSGKNKDSDEDNIGDAEEEQESSGKNKDSDEDNICNVSNNYRKVIQGLGESRRVVNAQSNGHYDVVNLFTTNYDLCHERALESSRYAYTDGFTNGIKSTFSMTEFHRRPADLENRFKDHLELVNPFFRLVKLHGSINWKSDSENSQIIRTQIVNDIDDEADWQDVLISPTSSKYALTQNEPYSDLFREFVNTLAVPNTVLFTAGFSFGDDHIAKLILDALARPDFTLYAFVSKPIASDVNRNGLSKFYAKAKSANAYFIYPYKDAAGKEIDEDAPLKFSDVADFFAPTIFTYTDAEDSDTALHTDVDSKRGGKE